MRKNLKEAFGMAALATGAALSAVFCAAASIIEPQAAPALAIPAFVSGAGAGAAAFWAYEAWQKYRRGW